MRGDVVGSGSPQEHFHPYLSFHESSGCSCQQSCGNGRLERYGRCKIGDCMDLRGWHLNRGDEAISSPGNVDNEPISVSSVAEHSTQCRNMNGKVRRLDENIRPNPSHQFLLTHQLTRAFKQHNQDLQSPTSEGHRIVAFQQKKLCRQQAKRPE